MGGRKGHFKKGSKNDEPFAALLHLYVPRRSRKIFVVVVKQAVGTERHVDDNVEGQTERWKRLNQETPQVKNFFGGGTPKFKVQKASMDRLFSNFLVYFRGSHFNWKMGI